jgi:hypothetical protein
MQVTSYGARPAGGSPQSRDRPAGYGGGREPPRTVKGVPGFDADISSSSG